MKLLDALKEKYDLKNDAAISKALEVAPPVISRIRNGKAQVSADIMIRIHETFGMPIAEIKALYAIDSNDAGVQKYWAMVQAIEKELE